MPRSYRAIRAGADPSRHDRDALQSRVPKSTRALQGRRPGDITAAAFRCAMHRSASFGETPHGAFPGVGLSSLGSRFTVWVWSGNRTRDSRYLDRCSNRLSYPVADEPDSNRRPRLAPLLFLLSYRPREAPSPGLGHTPRQRRAHRTGMRARTAGNRSIDVSHWRL